MTMRFSTSPDEGIPIRDAARCLTRVLLKAQRTPDRLVPTEDGSWGVEALWEREWIRVPFERESVAAGTAAAGAASATSPR